MKTTKRTTLYLNNFNNGDWIHINDINKIYGLNWEIKITEDTHFLLIPYILDVKSKEGDPNGRTSSVLNSTINASPYIDINSKPISRYEYIFNKFEGHAKQKLIGFLSKIPMFKTWSSTAIRRLLANVGKIHYLKDEVVYKQNEDATAFYIVYDGEFAMK